MVAILPLILACTRAPERVLLGVALNSSSHQAVQLAIDEINAAGGIDGVPLEAHGLDWRTQHADSATIIEWANRFADEPDLLGVVGHSDSAATLTSAAIYNRRQLPQLVTIATNPAITDIGPWTYRLCISDAEQGPALARYAVEDWGRRRLALLYVNDEYGKGLIQTFRETAEELGAEIVSSTLHSNVLQDDDKEHIRSVLRRLRDSAPEAEPDLFVLVQRTQAGLWTSAAIREMGLSAPMLGADNFGLTAFLTSYGPEAEGLRAASFYVSPPETERGRAFEAAFRERAQRSPDYGDAYAYDAVYLFRDAVLGGGFSRAGVKDHLDNLIADEQEIRGAGGPFVLGADHDARRSFYIVELRDGRYVPLQTIPTE